MTVRSGILGAGFMGRVHASAVRAGGGELVSVAASTPESTDRAAAALRAQRGEDAAVLLHAADIDLVHICTPNASHASLALAAIAAGKHVICEKPIGVTPDEARRLLDAAAAHGVVTAVPFVYRYHPMVREARARMAAGELGDLLTLDCSYLQDWMLLPTDDDWRAHEDEGGASRAFADIGSHLCDLVEFVTGERIVRLTARTRRVFAERGGAPVTNEDVVSIMVEMTSGAIGTLLVSQMAAGRKNAVTLEFHGSRESVRFEQERPEQLWIGRRAGSQLILRDPQVDHADSARLSSLPAGHPTGYQDAFNAFVSDVQATVRGASVDGLPTFDDGARAAQLTEAVLRAAREESWVDTTASWN